jgi:hypothetical protein
MKSHILLIHALLLAPLFAILDGGTASMGAAGADATRLRVIAESSLFNREAFLFVTSRFRLVHGTADTEGHAIASGPEDDITVVDGIWVVNDGNVRHEIIVDAEYMKEKMREAFQSQAKSEASGTIEIQTDIKFLPLKQIWGKGQGIRFSPTLHGGGFRPPDSNGPQTMITPFDMIGSMGKDERMHPARLIHESFEEDDVSCRVGTEEVDGRDLVVVSHVYPDAVERPRHTFWFDAERGFLPVRMIREFDDPKERLVKTVVTEVRECSNGRWFPIRTVKVCFPAPDQAEKSIEVFDLRVTELDVDTPPSDDMLAIEIPKGAQLHNGVEPNSQIAIQADRRIGVSDFDELSERMGIRREERFQETEQMQPVELSETPMSPQRWYLIGGGVAILLAAMLVLWFRWAREHRPGI